MPDSFVVLLDQNVPRTIAPWLRHLKPTWMPDRSHGETTQPSFDDAEYL